MSLFSFLLQRADQATSERWLRRLLAHMNIGQGEAVQSSGERWFLEQMAQLSSPTTPFVLFDVGANEGSYAQYALDAFQTKPIQLHCFEPAAGTFATLSQRLKESSSCHLHPYGLSHQTGRAQFYSNHPGSGLASIYPRNLSHIGLQLQATETIKLTSLDLFCKENHISYIDLLKLDVEGHELSVLQGASNCLQAQLIHVIQFEFGGCNIDSRTYLKDFFTLLAGQYALFRLLPQGVHLLGTYNELYEMFNGPTNFIAIRKGSSYDKAFIKK